MNIPTRFIGGKRRGCRYREKSRSWGVTHSDRLRASCCSKIVISIPGTSSTEIGGRRQEAGSDMDKLANRWLRKTGPYPVQVPALNCIAARSGPTSSQVPAEPIPSIWHNNLTTSGYLLKHRVSLYTIRWERSTAPLRIWMCCFRPATTQPIGYTNTLRLDFSREDVFVFYCDA
jgi:hypothetical protein